MKKEYILKDYYNSGNKWGDYIVYGLDKDKSECDSLDYSDLYNQVAQYYNVNNIVEESEEQKAKRLAKEKAEKRNNKINQILGE